MEKYYIITIVQSIQAILLKAGRDSTSIGVILLLTF